MGKTASFTADGGTTDGYLAEPATAGGPKGVIVLQEWWGLNDHIKDVAERFARAGFTALAPDLYHGTVARSPDEAGKLLMALNIAQAETDLRGAVGDLRGLTGRPVGVVGFCMGGTLSFFAACANGEDVGACVIYYGGHPKIQYDFDRVQAPVLGHWAEHDEWANQSQKRFREAFEQYGKRYEFHTYPGTKHAFFNDERPQVHDAAAAALSWSRTLAFFDQNL